MRVAKATLNASEPSENEGQRRGEEIGAELERKFPMVQVTIYDAETKTRTLVEAAK